MSVNQRASGTLFVMASSLGFAVVPTITKTAYDEGANTRLVKLMAFERMVELARQIKDYWFNVNVSPVLNSDEA